MKEMKATELSNLNLEERQQHFLEILRNNGVLNRLKILNEYTVKISDIKCECLLHPGEIFYVKAYTLRNGGGYCPLCIKEKKQNNKQKTHKQFIRELKDKGFLNKYEVIGKYVNAKTKIQCRCLIHKDCYFENTPTHLLTGQGCPICAREKTGISFKITEEEFDSQLKNSGLDIQRISPLINMTTKIKFKCLKCGADFEAIPYLVLQGYAKCPICGVKTSFNNRLLRIMLLKAKVKNLICEYSPKWAGSKRYDARFTKEEDNLEQNYIVEVNGVQHYEDGWVNSNHYLSAKENQENDKIKYELAIRNGAKIIYVNCSKKTKYQIFKEIKKQLNGIVNFDELDFKQCIIEANKSPLIEVCELYNKIFEFCPNISKKEFSRQINKPYPTVYNYLKEGEEIGLISTNKKGN